MWINDVLHFRERLVMEQACLGECHEHAVIIASSDDLLVAQRATWLHDISYAVAGGAINIVAERDQAVGTERHTAQTLEPFLLLLRAQAPRHLLKEPLPCVLFGWRQIITEIQIDSVGLVRALHPLLPGQIQDRGMLAQIPILGL